MALDALGIPLLNPKTLIFRLVGCSKGCHLRIKSFCIGQRHFIRVEPFLAAVGEETATPAVQALRSGRVSKAEQSCICDLGEATLSCYDQHVLSGGLHLLRDTGALFVGHGSGEAT